MQANITKFAQMETTHLLELRSTLLAMLAEGYSVKHADAADRIADVLYARGIRQPSVCYI